GSAGGWILGTWTSTRETPGGTPWCASWTRGLGYSPSLGENQPGGVVAPQLDRVHLLHEALPGGRMVVPHVAEEGAVTHEIREPIYARMGLAQNVKVGGQIVVNLVGRDDDLPEQFVDAIAEAIPVRVARKGKLTALDVKDHRLAVTDQPAV